MVLFFAVLAVGCYEVTEDIAISQNGSGTYASKMDLSQLVEMMQSFGGDEMKNEGLDKVVDTVINLKTITDSVKDMSPELKKVLSNGKVRFQMNINEKIFKIDTDCPFRNYDELQLLIGGNGGLSAMSQLMKTVMDKKDQAQEDAPDTAKDPDMGGISDVFDVVAKDGTISKKVNKAKYDALMSKPEMEQLKQGGSMGIEILYTTTIRLPRPVKTSDNPVVKLSDDKKTVTIKQNFLEVFESPDKFAYTITY